MNALKSNVTIRSNVFKRSDTSTAGDKYFLAQVRGRSALLALLNRVAPHQDVTQAARAWLTLRQISEVAWQAPCAVCGSLPEGPVTVGDRVEIQFRCPRQTCPTGNVLPRTILLDVELIRDCVDKFKKPPSELVSDALRSRNGTQSVHSSAGTVSTNNRGRVTVLLTRTQYHFLSDSEIEYALKEFLRRKM